MKKLFLSLCVLTITGALSAQRIDFHMGDNSNNKAYAPTMIQIAEGVQEGQLLIVEPELKAVTGPLTNPVKAVSVRLCDMEWKDVKKVTLDDTKGDVIQKAFRSDNRLHVLVSHSDKKILKLRHVVFDAQSLDIVTDNALVDVTLQKGDEGAVWTADSPNGLYHGVVYVVWSKKEQSTAVAMLYDKDMNKLWERELAYSDILNVVVCDNATIATSRLGMIEDNKDLTAFRINLANADGEKHGEFVLDADVSDMALMNTDGHNVLAVALEGKGGYGVLRIGSLGTRSYTGVWGLVFDLDAQRITVGNRHAFTDDDLCLFENQSAGTKILSHKTDYVRLLDQCTTPQGGAALYQRAWKVETRNARTGMTTSETVHSMGILMVQADMQGVLTINRIPQNNQNADWPKVGADVFPHNGKVYVLTNESKHETDEYTPGQPAQRSKSLLMANAALSLYWFTPDGQGAKQMLEKERKAILYAPSYAAGNGKFYFLAGSLKPCLCSITLP